MKPNSTTIAGPAILGIATLPGGFQPGNRHGATMDGHAASARDNTVSPSGKDARGSRGGDAAAKPLTVKQILARVNALMCFGAAHDPLSIMKIMGLLDKIRPESAREALAEAEAMTDPQARRIVAICLLAKWAEADGPAAMKYAQEDATGQGAMGRKAEMSVASAWAQKDPEAVWQWYQDQNAVAADQALANSGLDEAQIRSVKRGNPRPNQQTNEQFLPRIR